MAPNSTNDGNGIFDIHSFVIRIWLDEAETQTRLPAWHGQITYVRDGEQQYIKELNEISGFINAHLHLDGKR